MTLRLLLLCLLCSFRLEAASLFSRDVWINEMHTAAGVNVLAQDPEGFTWLGTDQGLFRFNGRTFTAFPARTNDPVTALYTYEDMVWVGYKSGLLAYIGNDGAWHPYRQLQPAVAVTGIYAAAWNTLLMVSTAGNGLYTFYQGYAMPLTAAQGLSDDFVYGLSFVGKDHHLLAGTDRGISRIRPSGNKLQVEQLNTTNGLPDNIVRVVRGLPGSGRLWAGMQEAGVALLEDSGQQLRVKSYSSQWPWGQVNDLLPLSGEEAWAITGSGYLLHIRLAGDLLVVDPCLKTSHELRGLLSDPAGNLWCATEQGLTEVLAPHVQHLVLPQHYDLAAIATMTCDTAGAVWYAMEKNVYCYTPGSAGALLKYQLPEPVTALYADSAGNTWIGTLGGGVHVRDGQGRVLPLPDIPGLKEDHILDITGNYNAVWVSGLNGVEELSLSAGGTPAWVQHHDRKSGLASDYIYQLHVTPSAAVWMATDGGGLGYYYRGRYEQDKHIPGFSSKVVYSVTMAGQQVWINTLHDGLFFQGKAGWQKLSRSQGLQDPDVMAIAGCPDGRVIVVYPRGIGEWYPGAGVFRHYNRRLGVDIDSSAAQLNCIAADRNGRVYVPGRNGFICFGNQPRYRNLNATIHLKEPRLFLKPAGHNRHDFDWDENHLTFAYEGISYANAERLHFRYRLEGYSNDWVETNDEAVTFPRLPPGRYLFRIQTALTPDFAGSREAVYPFVIATPVWKQAWFILLVIIVLIALGYYYIRARERNLRKLSLLQKERMTFEYEHLKSQVNPHFLFNSLNTLVQIIAEDQDQATEYAIHLSDLYRNMLSFRDRELISLSEEWSLLEQYIYIQQNRFGPALLIHREIPEPVLRSGQIVPMALQLLVENAIKHNVVSRESPLEIHITADQEYITVRNRLQPKLSREKGAGLGIANLQHRYQLLSERQLDYGIYENNFIVKLPLL